MKGGRRCQSEGRLGGDSSGSRVQVVGNGARQEEMTGRLVYRGKGGRVRGGHYCQERWVQGAMTLVLRARNQCWRPSLCGRVVCGQICILNNVENESTKEMPG